jgi:glycosyltransferase involved in cell wall biosynthesis
MRIGINLLYLLPGIVGGTETYAAGLLHGLAKIDRQDEFIVFVNQECAQWPLPDTSKFTRVVCPVRAVSRWRRYFYEQVRLPNMLKKHKVDVIHSLGYVGPLWTFCPSIVTIPDLNYIVLKQSMPVIKRLGLRFFSVNAARHAKYVVTISTFSKHAIRQNLKIGSDKIAVTHLGPRIRDDFKNQLDVNKIQQLYGVSKPYIIAFGGGLEHKNIPRLIKAFLEVKKVLSYALVLIGHLPHDVDLKKISNQKGNAKDIIATGYIPSEHVLPLLSGADAFVLPSLYEGFGLPVLEAQQAGVAVVCSAAGSLPEVAGDAAVYFDPYSTSDIRDKIIRVVRDATLREALRQKGFQNILRFSWESTASQTLALYKKAVSE